ncbi:ABC transporter substrate-binding protein [Phytoactinopolyspora endophytica]|uniref:ABC transporter substrate-binding protein n=1 Tax=Phytoactinopolyspora endophytica TaxID=1642495 RepID=UPI0013EB63D0|nr:extracellular solute-binding protein [Phytoactinopolyspora endophytica]
MLNRREMLRLLAAGGAAAASGAVITSCTGGTPGGGGSDDGADVVLRFGGDPTWPFDVMPSAEVQEENPVKKAYAEALQTWLDDNPGVTVEQVATDIWDQQALTTALSGGTAPAMFPGNVLGGWNVAATKSAFAQGLAADTTELLESYDMDSKLADYAKPIWSTWQVNGAYYGVPNYFGAGNGIYFRRDLIAELGLQEPQPGWTWSEFRELARALTDGDRKGAAFQSTALHVRLIADGWLELSKLPDPESAWNWRWDYTTTHADTWTRAIEDFRAMVFEDESILSDVAFEDGDTRNAFAQGRAAMIISNSGFFTADPNDTSNPGPSNLAESLGMPLEEVVGWIQHPRGEHGRFGDTQAFMTVMSFSPDLSEEALDKAVSLHDWMIFGQGWEIEREVLWEETQSLQSVFNDPAPVHGRTEVEGVPGDLVEAWGEQYMQAVEDASALPLPPNEGNYLPVEETAGPALTAEEDMESRWSFERGNVDIAADLANLEQTRNTQAADFTSSVDDDEFAEGARAYYEALQQFWQEHAPDYAADVFDPWYEDHVRPALG